MQELKPYTFKDTGITVMIRKVSPNLVMELQRQFPEPKPPLNAVDYGDGKEVLEPNYADPEYLKSVDEYKIDLESKIRRLIVKRGVAVEITDEIKAQLEELRSFWLEEYGKAFPEPNDLMAYVSYICVGTGEDMEELLDAIMRRSQPTESAIAEATKSFQS